MSNLSEEEIQKIKCIHLADYKASDKLCPAIEELKKEKENNKELMEEYHKRVQEKLDLIYGNNILNKTEAEKYFISKDKIREIKQKADKDKCYQYLFFYEEIIKLLEEE